MTNKVGQLEPLDLIGHHINSVFRKPFKGWEQQSALVQSVAVQKARTSR